VDAFQVIWAVSASFYGLLGLWAAVVRRHWFLRFAVVTAFLLGALLIPAYEVVLEFGIQIAVIAAGYWLASGQKQWQPRLSLATALLAMVVVAVVAAVGGQMPSLHVADWIDGIAIGMFTALASLLALWVVCGGPRLLVRLALAAVGMIIWIGLFHFCMTLEQAVRNNGGRAWMAEQYRWEQLSQWLKWWLPTIALAATLLLSALLLARASGWFTSEPPQPDQRTPRRTLAARVGLCTLFLLSLAPMAVLGYRLMTPPPWPAVALPQPNGVDDFIAAGQMVPQNIMDATQVSTAVSDAQLAAEIKSLQAVFDRIAIGMSRPCYIDARALSSLPDHAINVQRAIQAAEKAMLLKFAYVGRTGTVDERIDTTLDHLQFTQDSIRGTGIRWAQFGLSPVSRDWIHGELWQLLKLADRHQCRGVARGLYKLDLAAEPLRDQLRIERLIDANRNWQSHVQVLLSEWSGNVRYDWMIERILRDAARQRALVVSYALKAYCLEHDRPPPSLQALVPDYLPGIPADPHGKGPMKMTIGPKEVVVYSSGKDGDDDGGVDYSVTPQGFIDMSEGDDARQIPLAELGLEAAEPTNMSVKSP
jgi:hypothetical protein